jgi:hypothetical protein
MKPALEKALKPYRQWAAFDDSLGKLISIVYAETEQEEF